MKKLLIVIIILLLPWLAYSQDIGDYLIQADIGSYKRITKGGPSGNILAGAGHFGLDHKDKSYGIAYVNDEHKIWIDVQITQHSNSDSDRWLLHEVGKSFRTSYGIPGDPYAMRVIDGNTIIVYGSAGWTYRWLSGNKVIHIQYHDSQMTKPEPLEVVKAYLAKHPSILTPMTSADLRTNENKTKWIKDEMERRLWLCDKWFMALQLGKAEQSKVLEEAVENMNVFLDYREKYYGIKAADEKNLLSNYLMQNNGTGIKNKLTEYKTWWVENKGKAINL